MAVVATPSTVAQTTDSIFSGFIIPELTQDYFASILRQSVVQQICRQVPLGPTGIRIPHWNGNVTAGWVGQGGQKPVTKGSFTPQDVVPHKIATIFAESAEVIRINPLGYLETMKERVAEAIALSFDSAVLHGTASPFGAYVDQSTKVISLADPMGATFGPAAGSQAYTALNNGLALLQTQTDSTGHTRRWNGTLFDATAEPILNSAVDGVNRPLFIEPTYSGTTGTATPSLTRSGTILGRPSFLSDTIAPTGTTVGYMGDFNQIIWGQIGGISYDISNQATLDLSAAQDGSGIVSLWQNNLVAVLVEAEFGVLVNDPQAFVKLTNIVTA
jgi:HK97 family phage major capsid protein